MAVELDSERFSIKVEYREVGLDMAVKSSINVEEYKALISGGKPKTLVDDSERTYQAAVNEIFRRNGWLVFHDNDSRGNTEGFPDLIALKDGCMVVAELKTKRRGLTPEQYFWLLAFTAADKNVYLWRAESRDDWHEIERVAKQSNCDDCRNYESCDHIQCGYLDKCSEWGAKGGE